MPIRQGGILASRASTWPRDHFCRSTMAPRASWPTTWYQPLYRCGCLIGYDGPVSRSGAGMTRPSFLGVLLIGAADKRHVFGSLIRQRFAAIVLPGDRP